MTNIAEKTYALNFFVKDAQLHFKVIKNKEEISNNLSYIEL